MAAPAGHSGRCKIAPGLFFRATFSTRRVTGTPTLHAASGRNMPRGPGRKIYQMTTEAITIFLAGLDRRGAERSRCPDRMAPRQAELGRLANNRAIRRPVSYQRPDRPNLALSDPATTQHAMIEHSNRAKWFGGRSTRRRRPLADLLLEVLDLDPAHVARLVIEKMYGLEPRSPSRPVGARQLPS